jgi:hypothetical protein
VSEKKILQTQLLRVDPKNTAIEKKKNIERGNANTL